jgi:4-hydroxyphenylpyruvate dioxygenase-like putative hemolysin
MRRQKAMPEENQTESWALGSADLPYRCAETAGHIATLLRGEATREVIQLAGEGFVVPSPQALSHAAAIFEQIARLPGGVHWLQRPRLSDCVQVMVSFCGAIDGFEREMDVDAISAWWHWRDQREARALITQTQHLTAMVNAGELSRVLALYEADLSRAEAQYGANR